MRLMSACPRTLVTAAAVTLMAISPGSRAAEPDLFDSAPLSDGELADARGGFDLPNGGRIDFAVVIRTSVDGIQVLQTALQILGDSVTIQVEGAPGKPAEGASSGAGAITLNIGDQSVSAATMMSDLLVQHEIGKQIASLIVNTADNRNIENHVSIDLRLDGVQPLSLGSIGFRVQSLGVEAATWRAGG